MSFNPKAYAYLLYLRIDNPKCHKLLIEKFRIPDRGARIGLVDVDVLIEETPGGKDALVLQHPWMRAGLPILVSTRRNVKFFGYKDVIDELTRYHMYLDDYHASLQETKVPVPHWPTQGGGGAGAGGGNNPWHGMTPNPPPNQPGTMRPPTLIPTQPLPVSQPQPTQQPLISPPPPPIPQPPISQTPPIDPRQLQNLQPKSENKQIANIPVSLPPPQDPNLVKTEVLVPVKTDWSKIYQMDPTMKTKTTNPLLNGISQAQPSQIQTQPSPQIQIQPSPQPQTQLDPQETYQTDEQPPTPETTQMPTPITIQQPIPQQSSKPVPKPRGIRAQPRIMMRTIAVPKKGAGSSLLKRLASESVLPSSIIQTPPPSITQTPPPSISCDISTSKFSLTKDEIPIVKRPRIEPPNNPQLTKPFVKYQTVYDTVSERLKKVIDKWIIMVNDDLIRKLLLDIQSPNRPSDVYFIIGPTGSGKTTMVNYILKLLKIKYDVYEEFADCGNIKGNDEYETIKEKKHPCSGFLTQLAKNYDPQAIVIDGLSSIHADFIEFFVNIEYIQYQSYRLPNKSIFILVDSLENYTLRHWKVPTRIKMRMNLSGKERYMLSEMIQSVCPLVSDVSIRMFSGDYRRMGIDLIACTREAAQLYSNNTNQVMKVASIFDVTKHLNSFPVEPLVAPMLYVDEMDRLFPMVARNQFLRVTDWKDTTQMDEVATVAMQLSDIISSSHLEGSQLDDGSDQHGLRIHNAQVDTCRIDIFSLFQMMYVSNKRLGARNVRSSKNYQIEYEPMRWVNVNQTERNSLGSRDEVIEFKCVNKLERFWANK